MSARTRNDFDKPDKLIISPTSQSRTNYEAYTQRRASKAKTEGMFQNDPDCAQVIKHPGDQQRQNLEDLYRVNPSIKAYLGKQLALEDKKLRNVRYARLCINEEVLKTMKKHDRKVLQHFKKLNKEAWQAPPTRV